MQIGGLLKTWSFGIVLGIFTSVLLYEKGGGTVVAGLSSLSRISQSQNLLVSIFFKNSLSSPS
jgi:hypothetical protein